MKASLLLTGLCGATLIGAVACTPSRQAATTTNLDQADKTVHLAEFDGLSETEIAEKVAKYRRWQPLIDESTAMDSFVSTWCVGPTYIRSPGREPFISKETERFTQTPPAELKQQTVTQEQVASMPESPHQQYFAMVYINEIGESVIRKRDDFNGRTKDREFPEGTVIIKEKLPAKNYEDRFLAQERPVPEEQPVLLTVMIKMPKGYNPMCGDWWFGTLTPDLKPTSGGKLENCMTCHTTQHKNDFLFTGNTDENSMYKSESFRWKLEEGLLEKYADKPSTDPTPSESS